MTLKAARVNVGLTQVQAAEKLGVSLSTLQNYEKGKTYPNQKIIDAIEKLYKVEYNDLIFLVWYYALSVIKAKNTTKITMMWNI